MKPKSTAETQAPQPGRVDRGANVRRPYERPKLTHVGNLREQLAHSGGTGADGGAGALSRLP